MAHINTIIPSGHYRWVGARPDIDGMTADRVRDGGSLGSQNPPCNRGTDV